MPKEEKHRAYWTCACGGWTWAHTSTIACHKCGKHPTKAATQWVGASAAKWQAASCGKVAAAWAAAKPGNVGGHAPRSGNGDKPTASAPLQEWVVQPRGRKQQRSARREAAATGDQVEPINVDDDMEVAEEPSILQQLEAARKRVAEFEAVGDAAREAIPGFDVLLEAARAKRDQLQKDRKATRPVHWRLVEAQRLAKAKGDALDRAHKRVSTLREQHDQILAKITEDELEIIKAKQALIDADNAVAKILGELAEEAKPATEPVSRAADATVAAAEGLAQQLAALPAALAAKNAEAAVAAIQLQFIALVAQLRGDTKHDGSTAGGDGNAATSPNCDDLPNNVRHGLSRKLPRASGRRGTSPSVDHEDEDFSEAESRSRSRGEERLTSAELSAVTSSQRLDDMGFITTASSDPYDGAAAGSVGQRR